MDIASRRMTDEEAYGTSLPQCCNAHTAPNTRLQGLRSDLSTPQQHQSVDRLERNALVSVRRGDQKRSPPALHASAMIANVYRVQVTDALGPGHWHEREEGYGQRRSRRQQ